MKLTVEPVAKCRDQQAVQELYAASFLPEDRMPFSIMRLLSRLWHTQFLAFYDDDTFCGFAYVGAIGRLAFIMFLAVPPQLRSQGYGSAILSQLAALHPQRQLVVSIEPCDDAAPDLAQRLRRKKFYLANGYAETGYFLQLGKRQELLVHNGSFDKRALRRFFMLYSNFTMYPKIWREDD